MAKTPTTKTKRATHKEVLFALADFIKALPPQPGAAEDARATVLDRVRSMGWEG